MKKIEWNKSLSVGVEEIDRQHKSFIDLLNELFLVFYATDRNNSQIISIFEQAFNYAKFHFATEERYFYEFNYDGAVEHIKSHRDFGVRLQEMHDQFEREKIDPTIDLMDFFEDWLVNHLNYMDKKYAKCFHEHGLF